MSGVSNAERVQFLEDEAAFLKAKGWTAEEAAMHFSSQFQELKLAKLRVSRKVEMLEAKIPEHKTILEAVKRLQEKKEKKEEVVARWEVMGGVFGKAKLGHSDSVWLWLGANVLLEFSFEEAREFLETQLKESSAALEATLQEQDEVEDAINTLQVNVNRLHNYSIGLRKAQMAKQIAAQRQAQQLMAKAAPQEAAAAAAAAKPKEEKGGEGGSDAAAK